jgi:bifunctional non-homologous end joining protein LigD
VQWVEPKLVAEIEFTGWTEDGVLRHPSFLGLRIDKPAAAVRRERAARRRAAAAAPTGRGVVRVTGVTITHPERPVWPDEGVTKADLARYYETVGRWLLPHVEGRPLSLVRCPEGAAKQCFFQRHMGPERPPGVRSFATTRAGETRHYLYVDTLAAVVQLVQRGVVELHTWGSRYPPAGRPDRITIDLDPDPALPWAQVAESARLVRSLARELGLKAFLKTTGGKGLHVVMPIAAHDWDEVKSFARSMAETLARAMPDRFTATVAKRARTGKVFVDYLRNGEAASAVAAFSARARPGAPVSMPIAWTELAEDVRDGRFSVRTVPALLERRRADPWADYARSARALTKAMARKIAAAG